VKNPVVRIKIRVRLADGCYPFLDPVYSGNGKLHVRSATLGRCERPSPPASSRHGHIQSLEMQESEKM